MHFRGVDARRVFRARKALRAKGLEVPIRDIENHYMVIGQPNGNSKQFDSFFAKINELDRLESIEDFKILCVYSILNRLNEFHTLVEMRTLDESKRNLYTNKVKESGGEGANLDLVGDLVIEAIKISIARKMPKRPVSLVDLPSYALAGEKEKLVIRHINADIIDVNGLPGSKIDQLYDNTFNNLTKWPKWKIILIGIWATLTVIASIWFFYHTYN